MNYAEFQKLLNAEPPVTLKNGVGEWLPYFLVCLAALMVFYVRGINNQHPILMWPCILFFGVGALVLGYISFSPCFFLTLDYNNFTVRKFRRSVIYQWKDIAEFKKGLANWVSYRKYGLGIYRVYFKFNTDPQSKTAKLNRFENSGYDRMLFSNYGLKPDQLAQLMNHWRKRAIGAKEKSL